MSEAVVGGSDRLRMVDSQCSICGSRDQARPIGGGEDFEYRTSEDSFEVWHCTACDTLFLHPRPERSELGRIYPPTYHAYEFTREEFGLSFRLRRSIERRRLLSWGSSVPPGGAIVDVGSGDGFHLGIMRDFGDPTWRLDAIEPDPKAVEVLRRRGFSVHEGFAQDLGLDPDQFDFAMMIMVLEHLDDPRGVLEEVRRILKPGGRLGIVTDNIRAPDASLGRARHWGGYHFPRHFHMYSTSSLRELAGRVGLEVESIRTMVSPVNWTYTVHNYLADRRAPEMIRRRFTLRSPMALAVFTAVDAMATLLGRGALLRALLRKPVDRRAGSPDLDHTGFSGD